MTFLQFYLLANIYVLVFWACYRIWLKESGYFRSVRIYLNAALLLSLTLPFIQSGISELIGSAGIGAARENIPFAGIIYSYQIGENFSMQNEGTFPGLRIPGVLLLTGSMLTALSYIYNHLRIRSIIRGGSKYLFLAEGLTVYRSADVETPFIYHNRIVLPTGIAPEEIPFVLNHERLHYRNRHHMDNMLFSLLHILFWVNPFFLLLRKAHKLNHEYQVDRQVLSSGMDPASYKLSLVKFSVGYRKFYLAHGLSSSSIKNRLLMINQNYLPKGKWKFYLPVPLIGFLFTVFFCACIQPEQQEVESKTRISDHPTDTLLVKFIDVTRQDLSGINKRNFIVVLMNRNSKLMIDGEKHPPYPEQKIISAYNHRLEEYYELTNKGSLEGEDHEIRIIVQKDLAADKEEYQKLLDTISIALFKIRDMQSIRLFGGSFDSLSTMEQERINELIKLRIYGVHPDKQMGPGPGAQS